MARTTRFADLQEPIHIFQDENLDSVLPMTSHAPMPVVSKPARRPLSSSTSNITLNPPSASGVIYSPHKLQTSCSPRSPFKRARVDKLNLISMAPPAAIRYDTDSLQKKPFLSTFKAGPQRSIDLNSCKENLHPQIFTEPTSIHLSIDDFYQKPGGKRALMESAPIQCARPIKKAKSEDDDKALPSHDSFAPIADDGAKPPHSYAQLIGMAILRSPSRRLTLAQIYKWISNSFSFYNPDDAGWQNSIRHNLSLHKNFIKIERPKDDPGKGNYWAIEPGTEFQFLKEKPNRKSIPTAENLPVMSTLMEPSRPVIGHMSEPTLPPQSSMNQMSLPSLPTSQALGAEISSDATIPISDNPETDDLADKTGHNDSGINTSLYSPLPAALNSSPPISRHTEQRSRTPPPVNARNPSSSIARSHKRKFASMDDSGYISSLESSAMRPNQKGTILTSEADRPRSKRGRAEEEIARLRSSPFSPTKSRSLTGYGPASSSPLRQAHDNQMLPPLTPMIRMRPVKRPPPSASPNTNLRIHRDKVRHMLQSPLRRVTGVSDESLPWSPAFHLDENAFIIDNIEDVMINTADFDIFQDLPEADFNTFSGVSPIGTGSPVKRSAKRAGLERTVSASALGDSINSIGKRNTASTPFMKLSQSALQLDTPSKVFDAFESPTRMFQNSPQRSESPIKFDGISDLGGDWSNFGLDSTDFGGAVGTEANDFAGLDILQGFEKIGSGSQNSSNTARGYRPPLGRSHTTNT